MIEIMGDSLQQWEQGRKVVIKCEVPFTEVQFAHAYDKEALIVAPEGNTANIPNVLLQSKRALCVYLVHKTAEEERVIHTKTFTVGSRPKPSDYVYTETEVKNYDDLKRRIEALEEGQDAPEANGLRLTDTSTGKVYEIGVIDGKLTMEEVTE